MNFPEILGNFRFDPVGFAPPQTESEHCSQYQRRTQYSNTVPMAAILYRVRPSARALLLLRHLASNSTAATAAGTVSALPRRGGRASVVRATSAQTATTDALRRKAAARTNRNNNSPIPANVTSPGSASSANLAPSVSATATAVSSRPNSPHKAAPMPLPSLQESPPIGTYPPMFSLHCY